MVRFKNRYLVCEVNQKGESHKKLREWDIGQSVRMAVRRAYGDYGMGLLIVSLCVKYWNPTTKITMIRARRGAHQMLQAAVTMINSVADVTVFFRTLHIGGTIRSCQKFLIGYHQRELQSLLQKCKTEEERNSVKKSIIASGLNLEKTIRRRDQLHAQSMGESTS